jgi:hypothetical protein
VQIHKAWAQAELAPNLVKCSRLPGGLIMVVMEHLRQEDGWRMLCELEGKEQELAFEAAQEALRRAHAIQIPDTSGGSRAAVHGDVRGPNIMVKQDAMQAWQVRFIDLDWAGLEGTGCYPKSLFGAVARGWHEGARAGQPMRQDHDTHLLQALGTTGLKK